MSDQRWAKQAASALFGVARARRSETRAEIEAYASDRDDESDEEESGAGRLGGSRDGSPGRPGQDSRKAASCGLRAGEVVAFLENGLPYAMDGEPEGEAIAFGLTSLDDAVSVADPRTHLLVVKQGAFFGFKSTHSSGDGKLLQARHRGRARLCFFNKNHGVNEQWESVGEDPPSTRVDANWTTQTMRLRNRRLPSCVLHVQVTRVPRVMTDGRLGSNNARNDRLARDADRGSDTDAGDDDEVFATDGNKHEYKTNPQKPGVARTVAFHDDKTVGTPSTTGTYRNGASPSNSNAPPGHKKDKSGEEQTHALRSMSGVLIKEWSAFVLKEVKARKQVEAQMVDLRHEMRDMFLSFRNDVNVTRQEWIGDASFYGTSVRNTQEVVKLQRQKVVKMARATFAKRRVSSAFSLWRQHARGARRKRVAMRRVVVRMGNARLGKVMRSWRERTRARRTARRAISKSVYVGDRGVLTRAFSSWKRSVLVTANVTRNDRVLTLLQKRAIAKMRFSLGNSAFHGWRNGFRDRKRLRFVLTKVTNRWLRLRTSDAFYHWLSVSSGKRRRRDRLSKLVLRVFGREQHAVFAAWCLVTKKHRKNRHVVFVFAKKLKRTSLRDAFHFWSNESNAVLLKKQSIEDFARRTMGRWNGSALAKAFERWRVMRLVKINARKRAASVTRNWRNRTLHAAFTEWATFVMYRLAQKDNAMLFAVRLVRGSAHKAFRTWRDTTLDFVARRHKMRKIVQRWRAADMQSAFDGWRNTASLLRSQGKRARALVWRITHRACAKAFRAWSLVAVRATRARDVQISVLQPLLNRRLSSAFKGWRFRVGDLKQRMLVARRVVSRMTRIRAHFAFSSWLEKTRDAVHARDVIHKVLRKMKRVKLHVAFQTWTDRVVDSFAAKASLTRALRFAARRSSDRAEHVWRVWFTETRRLVSFRRRAGRAVSRIRLSVANRAFVKWSHTLRDRIRCDALLVKGANRFARFTARKVMTGWYRHTGEALNLKRVARKAARKLDTLKLWFFYRRWRDLCAEDLDAVAKLRRAAKLWNKHVLGSAWRSWTSSVNLDRVKKKNAKVHFAIKQAVRVERTRRKAWQSWVGHVQHYKRMSGLVNRGYQKSRAIYKQSVFDSWCAFVEEVERRKETLRRCVTSKRVVTAWFLDWYWRAFEGDISGALGLISESTENVMGRVYGDCREVDTNVFKQWRQIGSSLEALTSGADPKSPIREAARAWRERTGKLEAETQNSDSSFLSPCGAGGFGASKSPVVSVDKRPPTSAFATPTSGATTTRSTRDTKPSAVSRASGASSDYAWDDAEDAAFQSAGRSLPSNLGTPTSTAVSPSGPDRFAAGRESPWVTRRRLGLDSDDEETETPKRRVAEKPESNAGDETSADAVFSSRGASNSKAGLMHRSPASTRETGETSETSSTNSTNPSPRQWASAAKRMDDDMADVA